MHHAFANLQAETRHAITSDDPHGRTCEGLPFGECAVHLEAGTNRVAQTQTQDARGGVDGVDADEEAKPLSQPTIASISWRLHEDELMESPRSPSSTLCAWVVGARDSRRRPSVAGVESRAWVWAREQERGGGANFFHLGDI
jgi:hypothetical protein